MEVRKLTARDLEGKLKRAADILRKSLNASENYKLVLPLLFVKRLNDNFIEKADNIGNIPDMWFGNICNNA